MNNSPQFVGIKEFRQNIAQFAKTAREKKQRIVVMNRNKPLFEIKPFAEDEYLDSFVQSVLEAERDIAAGNFYTSAEVKKELGIV
jgi:hypothetical protein